MKKIISIIAFALICGTVFTSCDSNIEEPKSDEFFRLNLWRRHVFQSEQGIGRGFIFSFTTIERFANRYELVFEYQVDNDNRTIKFRMIDKINTGRCPHIPPAWGGSDGFCTAGHNAIFIPERSLSNGKYEFIVETAHFTVKAEFIVSEEMAILNIPENDYLTNNWQVPEIYIIPKNLIYGSVSVSGYENIILAFDFLEDGISSGVLKNTDYTLQGLSSWVNEDGSPRITVIGGGFHNISFLQSISCISDVLELAKRHLNNQNAINSIWFNSTNGDRVSLSRNSGFSISLVE